jgi:DNA-binding transcriptional MerR regulator
VEDAAGEDLLRTAEVLERTGITHQILYRYITLGLIEPSVVRETGLRLFHPDVVALIETIKNLNQRYSLRDIKEIYFKDERVRRHAERTRSPG